MAPQKAASPRHTLTSAPTETSISSRKPWIKKTPVQVVLDQIGKQQEKVDALRADLTREERELAKLNKAKTVLEEK
jgi:hypothetical protein